MNTQGLIDAVVQQTMVFIAQLATAGGLRTPLVGVADQIFLELTRELQNQGVRKKVIADMFGMALRTYHRKVRELTSSRTDAGHTLWEVVLGFLREREPVSTSQIQRRFRHDDPEVLSGVINDLVNSGLVYRAGRGDCAMYRLADEADFQVVEEEQRREANEYRVWFTVYRHGPVTPPQIAELARLSSNCCEVALTSLVRDARVRWLEREGRVFYESDQFLVPLGTSRGWEMAVLDHFQAMVGAISAKLGRGSQSNAADVVGGSTWSLDVWEGHPLEGEAVGTLGRIRAEIEDLRQRIDAHNARHGRAKSKTRVIFYAGQYVQCDDSATTEGFWKTAESQA